MRKTELLYTLLILTLPTPFAAATDPQQLFDQIDQNQDGQIALDEIPTQHARLFQRLLRTSDDNQDQELSLLEFQHGLQPNQTEKPLVEKQSSQMPGADALLLLLAKMDANADRKIEATEVPVQFRELFHQIEDRLGGTPDGVLSQREITQSAPKLSHLALRVTRRMDIDVELEIALLPKPQWQALQNLLAPRRRGDYLADPEQAREFFGRLDANNDGQITAAEVPEQLADRFEQLLDRADRNHDNQISLQELLALSRQIQRFEADRLSPAELQSAITRLLKQWDQNHDQQLSRDEAPRRMAARFDRIDADGNGQLSRAELPPVVELLSRVRPAEGRRQRNPKSRRLPGN